MTTESLNEKITPIVREMKTRIDERGLNQAHQLIQLDGECRQLITIWCEFFSVSPSADFLEQLDQLSRQVYEVFTILVSSSQANYPFTQGDFNQAFINTMNGINGAERVILNAPST